MKTKIKMNYVKKPLRFVILPIIIFAMFLAGTTSVLSVDVKAPAINVTMISQDPDPVGPGEYFEARFKIYNSYGGTTAKNFQAMIEAKYPFSLDQSESPIRSIGDLPAIGDSGNVVVLKYKIRVDEDAVEGPNPISLKYKYDGIDWIGQEFNINVQTVDANLAISGVETIPDKIKPGKEATLNIKVKNMADSTMKDISLKLDLTYSDLLSSSTAVTPKESINAFNSLPFAPISSATEQKIETLKPGEEHIFSYNIIAFSDALPKIYKVPIEINYYDELETRYSKKDVIGLIVGTEPDLSVAVEETDLYAGKKTGSVSIKFVNKGFSEIKFLDVKLGKSKEYEIISADEAYIGNIDSDDYETALFKLYLKGSTKNEKTIELPLKIEYRDANNNLYNKELSLSLNILKPEKLGIKKKSFPLAIVVLLALGIAFAYKKRKAKKAKIH